MPKTTVPADMATAFCRDIAVNPGDDTPRLVYADWLDQQSEATFAGAADAARDQRLAVVLRRVIAAPADDAPRLEYAAICEAYDQPGRAEFIRVQIELAKRCLQGPKCVNKTCVALRRREAELLGVTGHWARWTHEAFDGLAYDVGVACGDCNDIHVHLYDERKNELADFRCSFRRGFVASVTTTLSPWMGERCPTCAGAAFRHRCDLCEGSGRLPGLGARLIRAAPLESVRLSDREPRQTFEEQSGKLVWTWWREGEGLPIASLPLPLWNLLLDEREAQRTIPRECITVLDWPERRPAEDALLRILLRYAHFAAEREDKKEELKRTPVCKGTFMRDDYGHVTKLLNACGSCRHCLLRARLRELDALVG